jgi:cytoskeletal protein CcmA (bactofilin family)
MFEFGKKGSPDTPAEAPMQEMKRPDAHAVAEGPRARSAAPGAGRRDAAIIGPSIQLDGDLRGQEDLLIEGEVNGTIQLRNNSLTVGSQGKVKADVYAKEINVEGLVEGDLFGSERVSVRKSAQVKGNITSPHVSLEEGARFKGSIEMDSAAVESAIGTRRGANPAEAPAKPVAPMAGAPARSGVAS